MAKFIKLEYGNWLNIDKIEQMFTEMSTWRRGNKAHVSCGIYAVSDGGERFTILDITSAGVIPEGEKWEFDEDLEESAKTILEDIAEWLATFAAIPAQTTVAVPGDMRIDLILAMNAIVNNTRAEGAEECE